VSDRGNYREADYSRNILFGLIFCTWCAGGSSRGKGEKRLDKNQGWIIIKEDSCRPSVGGKKKRGGEGAPKKEKQKKGYRKGCNQRKIGPPAIGKKSTG